MTTTHQPSSKGENTMKRLMSVITVVWITAFFAGFAGGRTGHVADIVCFLAGVCFFAELAASYRRASGLRAFLRGNLTELLLAVPLFRGLRLLKAVRRVRHLRVALTALDSVTEAADIAVRARVRPLMSKILARFAGAR